jgi:hypothetical protein
LKAEGVEYEPSDEESTGQVTFSQQPNVN